MCEWFYFFLKKNRGFKLKLPKGMLKNKITIQKYCKICKNENNHFYDFDKKDLTIKYCECCNTCGIIKVLKKRKVSSNEELGDLFLLNWIMNAKEELEIKKKNRQLDEEIDEYERSLFMLDFQLDILKKKLKQQ